MDAQELISRIAELSHVDLRGAHLFRVRFEGAKLVWTSGPSQSHVLDRYLTAHWEYRRVELMWTEQRVSGRVNVSALARPKSADLWALGHCVRLFRASTAVLHRHAGEWERAFEIEGQLEAIGSLGDGSVMAVGKARTAFFDGERWRSTDSGLRGCRRVWGATLGCVNALSADGLFWFDGGRWRSVDLEARGIGGSWADGDGDSRGRGWIVGCNGTHSCMASGSGSSWTEDGCGSWYLYLVYVADDGHAFAAGGDGLWRHDGAHWIPVIHDGDLSRFPLALSAEGPSPVVVASKHCVLLQSNLGESTKSPPGSQLEVFTTRGWQTIRAPITVDPPSLAQIALGVGARVLVAQGSSVWESASLAPT